MISMAGPFLTPRTHGRHNVRAEPHCYLRLPVADAASAAAATVPEY